MQLARSARTHRNGHLASVPGKRSTGDPPVAHEQGSDRDRIHLSRQNLKIPPPRHTDCLLDRCARHADPHPNRSSPLVCYRAFSSSVSGSAFVCRNPPHILLATQCRHLQTQVVSRQIKVCHQIEAHKFRACRPYLSLLNSPRVTGCCIVGPIFSLHSSAPFSTSKIMTFRKTEYKITVLGSGGVGKTGKAKE